MNAKFLKATTFVVAGLFASLAVAQDDAAAPEVPAGPTPQEVAAQNMSELLELVKQGRSRAAGDNRAREQRFAQDKANQQSELNRAERERAAEKTYPLSLLENLQTFRSGYQRRLRRLWVCD